MDKIDAKTFNACSLFISLIFVQKYFTKPFMISNLYFPCVCFIGTVLNKIIGSCCTKSCVHTECRANTAVAVSSCNLVKQLNGYSVPNFLNYCYSVSMVILHCCISICSPCTYVFVFFFYQSHAVYFQKGGFQ